MKRAFFFLDSSSNECSETSQQVNVNGNNEEKKPHTLYVYIDISDHNRRNWQADILTNYCIQLYAFYTLLINKTLHAGTINY